MFTSFWFFLERTFEFSDHNRLKDKIFNWVGSIVQSKWPFHVLASPLWNQFTLEEYVEAESPEVQRQFFFLMTLMKMTFIFYFNI